MYSQKLTIIEFASRAFSLGVSLPQEIKQYYLRWTAKATDPGLKVTGLESGRLTNFSHSGLKQCLACLFERQTEPSGSGIPPDVTVGLNAGNGSGIAYLKNASLVFNRSDVPVALAQRRVSAREVYTWAYRR